MGSYMTPESTDFLIIGGGVIGINLAREAKHRYPDADVTLLEKEPDCGLHASGRNSGVLHAGFYYTADSLKARLTREGNRRVTDYCLEKNLRINRCGKLVVARNEADFAGIDELLLRARHNGVVLQEMNEKEAKEVEPRIRMFERALYSPATASVDPIEVMAAFVADARAAGVRILPGTRYLRRNGRNVVTSQGEIAAGYTINAGGLYADRIARDFGFSQDYRILPFKGLYLYANEGSPSFRTNIYPVPDLRNPFLGVHHTVSVNGHSKIGPTAIPCFWREHYQGLNNFSMREFIEVTTTSMSLMLKNDFGFRSLAWSELQKYYRPRIVQLASELATDVNVDNYSNWGKPGIRAQLLDIKNRRLEMDFRFEGDDRSFHVLNAVSPAFTCALTFSEFAFDNIQKHIH
jgi:(S)-2-hydroxyglutarate dehydrogenase